MDSQKPGVRGRMVSLEPKEAYLELRNSGGRFLSGTSTTPQVKDPAFGQAAV